MKVDASVWLSFSLYFFFVASCGERFSPWDSDVPARYQDLTARQLLELEERRFQPKASITLALLADPQATPDDFKKVIQHINARDDVDLILVLGDLTDHGLLHEYIWAAEALEEARVPYFTVIGNHDALSYGKKIYQNMFGPLNYSFDFSGYKFVMFNNNHYEFSEIDFAWLASELDEKTILGSHIPPGGGMFSEQENQAWLMLQSKAHPLISLHGHRGTKQGFLWSEQNVPYFVVPRLRGVRYALLRIDEQQHISLRLCRYTCGNF